jgi:hypothetical protein
VEILETREVVQGSVSFRMVMAMARRGLVSGSEVPAARHGPS